jgi:hypothetical protein
MAPSHSDGKDREAGPGGHAHFDCRVVTRRISNAASGLNRQAHSRSSFKINLTRAAGALSICPLFAAWISADVCYCGSINQSHHSRDMIYRSRPPRFLPCCSVPHPVGGQAPLLPGCDLIEMPAVIPGLPPLAEC